MTYYKANIDVLIGAEDQVQACDALSEALRPILQRYVDTPDYHSAIVDWGYLAGKDGVYLYPTLYHGHGFEGVPDPLTQYQSFVAAWHAPTTWGRLFGRTCIGENEI